MDGVTFERTTHLDDCWASWDFYPSQWNAGTLIVNCQDDPDAPLVAFAAPGVSIYGETGLDTGRWQRAEWPTTAAFVAKERPLCQERLALGDLCPELPSDFEGWALRATAAHIDRLRAFALDRPDDLEVLELADQLCDEVESEHPGALEGYYSEYRVPSLSPAPAESKRAQLPGWIPSIQISRHQARDLGGQIAAFLVLYEIYRLFLRDPSAQGAQVRLGEIPKIPVADFALWIYGVGHVLLPLAFLTWLFFRRRQDAFVLARNTVVIAGVLTMAAYVVLAPNAVYAIDSARSVPSDALATMPALHFVVAVAIAFFAVKASRRIVFKLAWLAYPAVVAGVLIVSGSNYVLPTIAGAIAVMVVSLLLAQMVVPRLWLGVDLIGRWRHDLSAHD